MGIITPSLSIVSNADTATTKAGPQSMALSMSGLSFDLTCDKVHHTTYTVGTSSAKILDGSKLATANLLPHDLSFGATGTDDTDEGEGGTYGSYLFFYNKSTVDSGTTNVIYIGVDHDGGSGELQADDQVDDGSAATRLFTLKCGEFAFLPFDYTMDIFADANLADQKLETWHWRRSAS